MTESATAQATLKFNGTRATDTKDHETPTSKAFVDFTKAFSSGTGADKINNQFFDLRSLADGANEELDLSGGLTDALGNTITFTKVRMFAIRSTSTNTTNLTIGGAAANAFDDWVSAAADSIELKPGGVLLLMAPNVDGYTVTGGSADLLKVVNAAGAIATYDIVIFGEE